MWGKKPRDNNNNQRSLNIWEHFPYFGCWPYRPDTCEFGVDRRRICWPVILYRIIVLIFLTVSFWLHVDLPDKLLENVTLVDCLKANPPSFSVGNLDKSFYPPPVGGAQ